MSKAVPGVPEVTVIDDVDTRFVEPETPEEAPAVEGAATIHELYEESAPADETAADAPAPDADAQPAGDTPPADPAQDAPTDTARYEKFGREVEEAFASNPVTFINRFIEMAAQSDPSVKAQLAAMIGEQPATEAAPDWAAYEPASDLEAELVKHIPALTDMPRFATDVSNGMLDNALQVRAMLDTMNLLAELVDVQVPQFDLSAVRAEIARGVDPPTAYSNVYAKQFQPVAEAARQSKKARATAPKTLRAASRTEAPAKEPSTIFEQYEAIGRQMGRT